MRSFVALLTFAAAATAATSQDAQSCAMKTLLSSSACNTGDSACLCSESARKAVLQEIQSACGSEQSDLTGNIATEACRVQKAKRATMPSVTVVHMGLATPSASASAAANRVNGVEEGSAGQTCTCTNTNSPNSGSNTPGASTPGSSTPGSSKPGSSALGSSNSGSSSGVSPNSGSSNRNGASVPAGDETQDPQDEGASGVSGTSSHGSNTSSGSSTSGGSATNNNESPLQSSRVHVPILATPSSSSAARHGVLATPSPSSSSRAASPSGVDAFAQFEGAGVQVIPSMTIVAGAMIAGIVGVFATL